MNILFLTTASLSTNPRLLKELAFAQSKRHKTETIAFRLGDWYDQNDQHIIKQYGFRVDYISATRSPFVAWLTSSIMQQVCKLLWRVFKNNILISALASNKRTFLLFVKTRRIKAGFDLIVAHNLGAFYPAFLLAKKRRIPFALDVEDFHPGEKCSWSERSRRMLIFEKIVARSGGIYHSSPLIETATLKLLKDPPLSAVINNVFSKTEFVFHASQSNDKINLVWFSQNISAGRGLELIVPSIFEKGRDFQLVLIGKLNQEFYKHFLQQYANCLLIKQPMSQTELHAEIGNHDIGLALELDAADDNRKLCLTNKIWAYYQAGLFIMATNTPAQASFIEANQVHGAVVKQSKESIDLVLSDIWKRRKIIRENKQERFLNAKKNCWEEEQDKLLQIWEHTVQTKVF